MIMPDHSRQFEFNTICARNVNEALCLGMGLVADKGVPVVSRGLHTLEVPGPVATVYGRPWERVLFDPVRDANPFFHFFESMWILAGSNRVEVPRFFLGRITDYSDNGKEFHGAYGHRLREGFGRDQLLDTARVLRNNPYTRQAVMSIWDPKRDLAATSKDIPCNDIVMFKLRDGRLNMTVCNRSNDVIWGAYGANAVQFSILQEWVAASAGVLPGRYVQMSDSYHVYTDLPLWQKYRDKEWQPAHTWDLYNDLYSFGEDPWVCPERPLFHSMLDAQHAMEDCEMMCSLAEMDMLDKLVTTARHGLKSYAFRTVGVPMLAAYLCYKAGAMDDAIRAAVQIDAPDWRWACQAWIERRMK